MNLNSMIVELIRMGLMQNTPNRRGVIGIRIIQRQFFVGNDLSRGAMDLVESETMLLVLLTVP